VRRVISAEKKLTSGSLPKSMIPGPRLLQHSPPILKHFSKRLKPQSRLLGINGFNVKRTSLAVQFLRRSKSTPRSEFKLQEPGIMIPIRSGMSLKWDVLTLLRNVLIMNGQHALIKVYAGMAVIEQMMTHAVAQNTSGQSARQLLAQYLLIQLTALAKLNSHPLTNVTRLPVIIYNNSLAILLMKIQSLEFNCTEILIPTKHLLLLISSTSKMAQ
jgi:hypothetical protein